MPLYIDGKTALYRSLRSNVSGEIDELTDFTLDSPEYTLLYGLGEYLYVLEHARAAAQLSGWVRFAGGPVTDEDIRELYPPEQRDAVDKQLLSSFMSPYDLKQLGELVGVDRDPGTYATGRIQITTARPDTKVKKGLRVATVPGGEGQYLVFKTVETVTTGADATAMAKIKAVERGDEYNVGSHTIEYIPEVETVQASITAVTNPEATSGGEDKEPIPEYRTRITNALTHASAGGTVAGIKGSLIEDYDGVGLGDVLVDEYFDTQRTLTWRGNTYTVDEFAYVVVNGGPDDETIQDDIDRLRPTCTLHLLRRPYTYEIDVQVEAVGVGIDTLTTESAIATFISDRALGENIVDKQLTRAIMNESEKIEDFAITKQVNDEPHTYQSGTAQYGIRSPAASVGTVTGTVSGSDYTFDEGTDYAVKDTDNDDQPDLIDFSLGGKNPDDGTTFYITYEAAGDIFIREDEVADPGVVDVKVVGDSVTEVE